MDLGSKLTWLVIIAGVLSVLVIGLIRVGQVVVKRRTAALLAEHGILNGQEIVAHCQTGIRSSYATLVLQALGYDQVKNYDGSWIEWANNPDLPIISGSETSKTDEIALLRK